MGAAEVEKLLTHEGTEVGAFLGHEDQAPILELDELTAVTTVLECAALPIQAPGRAELIGVEIIGIEPIGVEARVIQREPTLVRERDHRLTSDERNQQRNVVNRCHGDLLEPA